VACRFSGPADLCAAHAGLARRAGERRAPRPAPQAGRLGHGGPPAGGAAGRRAVVSRPPPAPPGLPSPPPGARCRAGVGRGEGLPARPPPACRGTGHSRGRLRRQHLAPRGKAAAWRRCGHRGPRPRPTARTARPARDGGDGRGRGRRGRASGCRPCPQTGPLSATCPPGTAAASVGAPRAPTDHTRAAAPPRLGPCGTPTAPSQLPPPHARMWPRHHRSRPSARGAQAL
jgi:hypothetical protein